jgi:hypothetical protein
MMDSNFYSNGNGGIYQNEPARWLKNEGNFEEHNNFLFEKGDKNEALDCSYDTDGYLRDAGQGDCW